MPKIYDDSLTAAQEAVAREYRKAKNELGRARAEYERELQWWEENRNNLEPRLAELKQGLLDMGLDPADFD